MKRLILIKLGGSLITDKEKPFTPKTEVIDNLSKQIKEVLKQDKNLSLIIGNGGGSFPHYPAVKYKMNEGIKDDQQRYGFCLVQDAAARLNRIIVASLLKNRVNACSVSPSSMILSEGGKIKNFFIQPVVKMLDLNIIPVIYGDIVVDTVMGAKIFSTEHLLNQIVIRLKNSFKIIKVIHNGLTKGVLDSNGGLIKRINSNNFNRIKKIFYQTKGFDVTGGMAHKVKECIDLAKYGIPSLIINGSLSKDILKKAILGEKIEGTLID